MKLVWKGLRYEMLCTKQITKYVGKSKSKLPCFIPMKVMPIVVCECTVCYYVTLATMWPVCSLLQTKHPYQHQMNTGNHTEKMDKGRSAIWSSHFLGRKFLHPWESTVSCKSMEKLSPVTAGWYLITLFIPLWTSWTLGHPSPSLTLSDFHFFPKMKKHLQILFFQTDEDIKAKV